MAKMAEFVNKETPGVLDLHEQTDIEDWNALEDMHITELDVSGTNFTDESAKHISKLTKLKKINLIGTKITDLDYLKSLKNLEVLLISLTDVKDITILAELPNLQSLYANTSVPQI